MGGTIKRFQDIKAWQEAREVVKRIYTITRSGELGKDFILRDQMRRAALSIVLNIAEGFGRGTDKEFRQFLMLARGSVAELQSALYVALDQQYISQSDLESFLSALDSLSSKMTMLARYLGDSSDRKTSPPRKNQSDQRKPPDQS